MNANLPSDLPLVARSTSGDQPVKSPDSRPEAPGAPIPGTAVPADEQQATLADTGGVALPLVGLLLLIALVAGCFVGWWARRERPGGERHARRSSAAPSGTAPGPATSAEELAPSHAAWLRERRRASELAEALVDARDRVAVPALAERISAALERAGYYAIDPVGTPFDPDRQRAVDSEPTGDPALDGTVAATERLGYRDAGGTLLRAPEVIVHRFDATSIGENA